MGTRLHALVALLAPLAVGCTGKPEADPGQVVVGPDTTWISGPRTADGRVDYGAHCSELARSGKGMDDNALVPLLRALGPDLLPERADREQLPVDLSAGRYFEDLDEEHVSEACSSAYEELIERARPWSAAEHPELSAWLDAQRPFIELFLAAADKPVLYVPLEETTGNTTLLESSLRLADVRDLARAVTLDAGRLIRERKLQEAWRRADALWRMGRLVSGAPSGLVGRLIANSIRARGFALAAAVGQQPWLTAEQRARCVRNLHDVAELPPLRDSLLGERFLALDSVLFAMSGADDSLPADVRSSADVNAVLRKVNHWYDATDAELRQADRAAALLGVQRVLLTLNARLEHAGNPWNLMSDDAEERLALLILATVFPAAETGLRQDSAELAGKRLARLAFALEAHRARTGEYPASLESLEPAVSREDRLDPLTGESLRYHRTDPSRYVLYSVGEDAEDDGGDPDLDIVLRTASEDQADEDS